MIDESESRQIINYPRNRATARTFTDAFGTYHGYQPGDPEINIPQLRDMPQLENGPVGPYLTEYDEL